LSLFLLIAIPQKYCHSLSMACKTLKYQNYPKTLEINKTKDLTNAN
jgi:hypothetical protein